MQHEIILRMVIAHLLEIANRCIERQPLAYTERKFSFTLHVFVDQEILPTGIVLRGSHSPLGGILQSQLNRATTFLRARRRHLAVDQLHRRLAQNAGGLAYLTAVDFPSLRISGLTVDARRLERS